MEIARGGSPRPIQNYLTDDINGENWIKISDTDKGGKYINSTKERIDKSGVSKSRKVFKGDFLLTNSMSFGRPYILNIDGCIHDGWLVLSNVYSVFIVDFLYYLLSSPFAYYQFCNSVSGAVVKNLNSEKVAISFFPLPPLAEQHRIVAKIEELLPYIDRYDEAEQKLTQLNKDFPDKLKKSLLQYAIQGKLVPQNAEDEPASVLLEKIRADKEKLIKEKKIKRDRNDSVIYRRDNEYYEKQNGVENCISEQIPFDIPDGWEWVRLGNIFSHNTGKALNSSNNEGTKRPYITTSNLYWNKFELSKVKEMYFSETETDKCTVTYGDLLVCEGGDIGRAAIWNYDYQICIQNHIHRLRAYFPLCVYFYFNIFLYYKSAGLIGGKGIGIQGLSSNVLHNLIVPLPPLSAQHRIVAKIEEFLPLCEQLT